MNDSNEVDTPSVSVNEQNRMTRREAINHINGLAFSVEQEFSCSSEESSEILADVRAALLALGVTDEELS